MGALLSRKGTLSESEVAAAFAELEASTAAADAFLNEAAPDVNEVLTICFAGSSPAASRR